MTCSDISESVSILENLVSNYVVHYLTILSLMESHTYMERLS